MREWQALASAFLCPSSTTAALWTFASRWTAYLPRNTSPEDNVVIDMDFVLYYRVLPEQAEKSVLEVVDHRVAVRSQAVADLRSIVGNIELSEALAERERIQHQLQAALEENTGRWGVKVQGVAINEIDPPPDVKRAMDQEKSAAAIKTAQITESEGIRQSEINKAEGERQSAILRAQGDRESAILQAEGKRQAQILEAEGYSIGLERIYQVANTVDNRTMSLEYFDTLKEIGKKPRHQVHLPHGVHLHAPTLPRRQPPRK